MAAQPAAIRVRAARAGDGPRARSFMQALSPRSRYQRFFGPMNELPPGMAERLSRFEPSEAVTLYAVASDRAHTDAAARSDVAVRIDDGAHAVEPIVGIGEYVVETMPRAEFAVVVAEGWRRAGIGTRLLQGLVATAQQAGITRLEGDILADNEAMLRLVRKLGFALTTQPGAAHWRHAWLEIGGRYDICLHPEVISMEA